MLFEGQQCLVLMDLRRSADEFSWLACQDAKFDEMLTSILE